jgi:hypothetical protein
LIRRARLARVDSVTLVFQKVSNQYVPGTGSLTHHRPA